jgi:MoaA/NifB/PqqE/SkfB family radical SAM enzyme
VTTSGTLRTEWSIDAFTRLIDDLAEQGLSRVSITGGEPFAHPNLLDLFAVLSRHGIESKINTNGLLADPTLVAKLIDHGLVEIDVSINDPDDDSSSYKRPANYASDRIAAVGRLAERLGDRLAVNASSVLTRHMLTRLEATEEELAGLGVARWRLREMMPSAGRSLTESVMATPNEAAAALKAFASRSRRLLVYGYLIDGIRGIHAGRRCRNLERNYIYISYDGQCWWMAGLTGAPLGNATADGVPTIARRLRNYRTTMEPPVRCATCPARMLCVDSPENQQLVGVG